MAMLWMMVAGPLWAVPLAPTSLTVSVSMPAVVLQSVPAPQGTWLRPEGPNNEQEGHPQIAVERFSLLLPPEADLQSVKLEKVAVRVQVRSLGVELAPCGRVMLDTGVALHPDLALDQRGRDPAVYNRPLPYPDQVVRITGHGCLRNVKFVSVEVARLRYRPLENMKIEDITNCTLTVSFQRKAGDLPPDNVGPRFRARLDEAFLNGADAPRFYPQYYTNNLVPFGWNYLIITTAALTNNSASLAAFKAHKTARGFRVRIQTIEQICADLNAKWRASGRIPINQEPANLIRWWLQDVYQFYGLEYVLLIGDPDPWDCDEPGDAVGEVPMKMMWPDPNAEYPHAPSHYYFADLDQTWDGDGDGYAGEFVDDARAGGWILAPEVYVGQIPFDTAQFVDPILEKFMAYENEPGTPIWRNSVLLASSWSDSETDSAYMAEELINGVLQPWSYSPYTLYQHQTVPGGISNLTADSTFASDGDLWTDSMMARWVYNTYGLVSWQAHGSEQGATVGNEETGWGNELIDAANAGYLDDSHPALVISSSCLNGSPSFGAWSLAGSLLFQGAIGTVCPSDVSFYTRGATSAAGTLSSAGIRYELVDGLLRHNKTFGAALYDAKFDLGPPVQYSKFKNLLVFNLYGDPAMDWNSWCRLDIDPRAELPLDPVWSWQ